MKLSRVVADGALAGVASGVIGALALYTLVEPSIRKAIALEESSHHEAMAHAHDVVVSRGAQVAVGMLTLVVVGVLIGIAFAIVHNALRDRLPGASPFTRSLSLAGLGFAALTLVPALTMPAGPPGVGEPDTINYRTTVYVLSIVCGGILVGGVVTLTRTLKHWPIHHRGAAAVLAAVVGIGAMFWALPAAASPVPATFGADLIWQFRIASLAQLELMWVTLAVVFGWLRQARARLDQEARRPAWRPAHSVPPGTNSLR